jgi:hypothetical protein
MNKMNKAGVIPNSGPDVDAAAYAIGRNHKDMAPLGGIKANMGLGRRGADQPKESPKYPMHRG